MLTKSLGKIPSTHHLCCSAKQSIAKIVCDVQFFLLRSPFCNRRQNQSLIAKSIDGLRGSMTILTIAHRPSMIFADWVVAIENGQIVEVGQYRRLKEKSGSRLSRMLSGEQPEREPAGAS